MTKEELKKHVIHELEWLKYYAREDTREKLNTDTPIYNQLISIGYAKRVFPLPYRCASATISIDNTKNIKSTTEPRNVENGNYTPLESWLILYPESFNEVKKYLLREVMDIS